MRAGTDGPALPALSDAAASGLWNAQVFIPKLATYGLAGHPPAEMHAEGGGHCVGRLLRWFVRADDLEGAP